MEDIVLFVDDDENLLHSYNRQFRNTFNIRTASGGLEALEKLKENPSITVIISDYSMPYMNGIELFQSINSIHPNTIKILITGYADINIAMDAINKGHIFRFITKPFDIKHLENAIENGLYQHKLMTLEKSDLLKNEFLNIISHEVRTPLNGITSFLEIIKEEISKETYKKLKPYFDIIDENTYRLLRTIHLMIDISEVHSKTFETNFRSIKLVNEIIKPIVERYSLKAKSKNIVIDINIDDPEYNVYYDKYCLEQILSNIIDNAIAYNYDRFVAITISRIDSRLKIEIKDDGIGIRKEFLEKMFEPFVQAEGGLSRSYEGNGLGLTLVKEFCNLMNIKIDVSSNYNEGTSFILYLNIEE